MPSSRRLTLLEPTPLAPLPTLDEVVPPDARRPGELHEALLVSDSVRTRFAELARTTNLTSSAAATILLEAGLAVEDLTTAGVADAETRLDRAADARPAARPMSTAEGDYLRSLTIGRLQRRPDQLPLSVPVRILARLRGRDIEALACSVSVEQARRWERHALEEGRTLGEWALVVALRG